MRHPDSNQEGKEVPEISVHSVQIQASGSLIDWVSVYSELLYNLNKVLQLAQSRDYHEIKYKVRELMFYLVIKNKVLFMLLLVNKIYPLGY